MQLYLSQSNDDWMLFRGVKDNTSYIALWNCEDQRMSSIDFHTPYQTSPVFINEGTTHNPPTIAVGIGITERILLQRNLEKLCFMEFKVPEHSGGLAQIFCSIENKLYSRK